MDGVTLGGEGKSRGTLAREVCWEKCWRYTLCKSTLLARNEITRGDNNTGLGASYVSCLDETTKVNLNKRKTSVICTFIDSIKAFNLFDHTIVLSKAASTSGSSPGLHTLSLVAARPCECREKCPAFYPSGH